MKTKSLFDYIQGRLTPDEINSLNNECIVEMEFVKKYEKALAMLKTIDKCGMNCQKCINDARELLKELGE